VARCSCSTTAAPTILTLSYIYHIRSPTKPSNSCASPLAAGIVNGVASDYRIGGPLGPLFTGEHPDWALCLAALGATLAILLGADDPCLARGLAGKYPA
jgi:hypothetical protein